MTTKQHHIQFRDLDLQNNEIHPRTSEHVSSSRTAQRDLRRYYQLLFRTRGEIRLAESEILLLALAIRQLDIPQDESIWEFCEKLDQLLAPVLGTEDILERSVLQVVREWNTLQRLAVVDAIEITNQMDPEISITQRLITVGLIRLF